MEAFTASGSGKQALPVIRPRGFHGGCITFTSQGGRDLPPLGENSDILNVYQPSAKWNEHNWWLIV